MTDYDNDPTKPITRRLRYFDNQLLGDQDFIDEQRYHLDRLRRASRAHFSPGRVEGLEVILADVQDLASVTVNRGTAVDRHGRWLVLDGTDIKPTNPAPQVNNPLIGIKWAETEVLAQEGNNTRFDETPEIQFYGDPSALEADGAVLLATLVRDNGQWLVRPAPRAGLSTGTTTFDLADGGKLTFQGNNSRNPGIGVTGDALTIYRPDGTNLPTIHLQANEVSVAGKLTVAQGTTTTKDLTVQGELRVDALTVTGPVGSLTVGSLTATAPVEHLTVKHLDVTETISLPSLPFQFGSTLSVAGTLTVDQTLTVGGQRSGGPYIDFTLLKFDNTKTHDPVVVEQGPVIEAWAALSSFQFRYTDNDDHHVKHLCVVPKVKQTDSRTITVTLDVSMADSSKDPHKAAFSADVLLFYKVGPR